MWQALNILSALSDVYFKFTKVYRMWNERAEARAQVAEQIGKAEKKFRDETVEIANRDLSDDELNRRLQDGQF